MQAQLSGIGEFLANSATDLLKELHRTAAPPLSHRNRSYGPGTIAEIDIQSAQPCAVRLVPEQSRGQQGQKMATRQ